MSSKRFDVVGIGYNTIDHVCVTPRPLGADRKQRALEYFVQAGGQVPTALVALQRWGMRTAYIGPFGDDEGGRLQRASLKDAGVDVSTCPTRTGVASHTSFVFVDRVTGERTIHWHRPLELCLPTDEIDRGVATGGRALLMDADDIDAAIEVAGWARREKTRVMLDVDEPHPRTAELLALVDFAIVSGDFAQRLSGASDLRAALRWMSRLGPRFVAATLGAGGSLAHAKGKTHYQDAFPARTVDTTSAGDVFHAACLYAALRGRQLPQIMSFASTAAGLTCEKLGGRAAIPSLEEIEARL